VPAEVLIDQRARYQAKARTDPQDRRHQADAAGDPLARKLIPGDRERQREDAAGHPLDHAGGDQHRQRLGDRRQ
jgi:hypothetical protein